MPDANQSPGALFVPTPGGPKIILLDLQGTTAIPPRHNPPIKHILESEDYKDYLIGGLSSIKSAGWEIHIFTVRNIDRREATLESIEQKAGGWTPDDTWFNDLGNRTLRAPQVKSVLLDRLIEECRPSALYAFESNGDSRNMFKERKVPCRAIDSPEALRRAMSEIALM